MVSIDRRALCGLAVVAGLSLAGCAGTPASTNDSGSAGSAPTGSAPVERADDQMKPVTLGDFTVTPVAEDKHPLDTAQKSCWKPLDDSTVLITLWGSTNPRPAIKSATVEGDTLAVVLKTQDGPTTMDLAPSPYEVSGTGLSGVARVTVDYGDDNPTELPSSQA